MPKSSRGAQSTLMDPLSPKTSNSSYFSISHQLVAVGEPLPFDIYINSSSLEGREHYIKIFKKEGVLLPEDPIQFQHKYHRLYIAESQRGAYLKSLCKVAGKKETEKSTVLRDSAIQYLGTLFDPKREVTVEMLNQALTGCRDVVEGLVDVLQSYNVDQLQELIANLSFHDFYTYDHSINVSMYCIVLSRALNPTATRPEIINAGFGGLLHDLGKIKIPTEIINKPGKLTSEEFAEIKRHPELGRDMLLSTGLKLPEGINIELLLKVIYEHHENFDGTGYPNKVVGEAIDYNARVCAVADFFDAITTKRSYHSALSIDEALALMKESVGKKLDPYHFGVFAKQSHHFDLKRKSKIVLPIDFDPCQPRAHDLFDIKKIQESQAEPQPGDPDFGKIIFKPLRRKKAA